MFFILHHLGKFFFWIKASFGDTTGGNFYASPRKCFWASLVAKIVKNPPAMRETWVWSLVGKISWRRAWQPTPVFLPGESPWTKELGGLQSMVFQRVRHNWATKHWRCFKKKAEGNFHHCVLLPEWVEISCEAHALSLARILLSWEFLLWFWFSTTLPR